MILENPDLFPQVAHRIFRHCLGRRGSRRLGRVWESPCGSGGGGERSGRGGSGGGGGDGQPRLTCGAWERQRESFQSTSVLASRMLGSQSPSSSSSSSSSSFSSSSAALADMRRLRDEVAGEGVRRFLTLGERGASGARAGAEPETCGNSEAEAGTEEVAATRRKLRVD